MTMHKQLEGMMIKHQQDRVELEEEEMKYLQELHQQQQAQIEEKRAKHQD